MKNLKIAVIDFVGVRQESLSWIEALQGTAGSIATRSAGDASAGVRASAA